MGDKIKPYSLVSENDFDRMQELARMRAEAEKPPSFSEIEMEVAKKDAFQKGHDSGSRDALTNQEERIANCLEKLITQFDHVSSTQEAYEAVQQKEIVSIAFSITKCMMPILAKHYRLEEIEELIKRVLQRNIKVTELTIYVHPLIFSDVQDRITPYIQEGGFANRVSLKEDSELTMDDCRVSWENGGVNRVIPQLWKEITEGLEQFLDGVPLEDLTKPKEPAIENPDEENILDGDIEADSFEHKNEDILIEKEKDHE